MAHVRHRRVISWRASFRGGLSVRGRPRGRVMLEMVVGAEEAQAGDVAHGIGSDAVDAAKTAASEPHRSVAGSYTTGNGLIRIRPSSIVTSEPMTTSRSTIGRVARSIAFTRSTRADESRREMIDGAH